MVLDEADLLLTGGFQRDVRRILDALREGDRAQRSAGVARQLGVSSDSLASLPRHLRKAAAQGKAATVSCMLWSAPGCAVFECLVRALFAAHV